MSDRIVDEYATRGARLVHQLVLMEEERRPLPEDSSPAMLVTRVYERLIQASCAIEWKLDEDDDGLLEVAVYFIGAAGFALTAIAHTQCDPERLARCKDALMEQLDQEVAQHLEASRDFYASATPDKLLRCCLALMLGASQCVAELEGVVALPEEESEREPFTVDDVLEGYEPDLDDEDGDDDDEDTLEDERREELLEQIAESLWQTAIAAAAAGQWLVELHESS